MEFQSRGVFALVQLHEHEMRTLYRIWLEVKKRGITLPKTDDPDYASLDHLMRHHTQSRHHHSDPGLHLR